MVRSAGPRRGSNVSKSHKDLHDEYEAESSYQSSANQVRDEPLPASHHDDPRQEAVERNEEQAGPDHSQATRSGNQHPAEDQNGPEGG
jgi:hypothetical protein